MRAPWLGAAALGSLFFLGACSSFGPEGPETVRGPAILVHYGDTTTLSVPSSARVGVPISITVTSFGGGCIGPGETEVTFQDSGAEIRPHRYETVRLPPDMGCTRELRVFQHTATLQFAQAGEARVRIVGLARPGDAPFVVERSLTVLP